MEKYKKYKDKEKRKEYNRIYQAQYMKKYRAKLKAEGKPICSNRSGYLKSLRLKVFEILGGAMCSECGCDVYEILEINHKKGDGFNDRKTRKTRQLIRDIIYNRTNIEDYNVLCKVCNIRHYVDIVRGIKGHKIIWDKPH